MPANKRPRDDMEEGARKRMKHDRNDASVVPSVIDLSSDAAGPSTTAQHAAGRLDDESTKSLHVLHADFDALRSLVTCKICERLLYEPYVLSCGHTYCYSCLCTWFQGKHKKTCPNCREVIRHMPAPSYVIKEMTAVFISRSELVPDGETLEQHVQWQQEESDIVQTDRNDDDPRTGGLFKGSFADRRHTMRPVFDREDGVERCPGCNWEMEDGVCSGCGYRVVDSEIGSEDEISDDVSDEINSDEDDFDDVDADFGQLAAHDVGMYGNGPPRNLYDHELRYYHGHGHRNNPGFPTETDDEEDDEDDDEEHSLDGFIDDGHQNTFDGIDSASGSEDDPSSSIQSVPRMRRIRTIISDDEDDEQDEHDDLGNEHELSHIRRHVTSDEDEDSEPEIVAVRPRMTQRGLPPAPFTSNRSLQSIRRRGPPITLVDSDDESLDSDSDADSEAVSEDLEDASSSRQNSDDDTASVHDHDDVEEGYGFSPPQLSDEEERGSFDGDGDGDDDEHFTWPGRANEVVATTAFNRHPPVSALRSAVLNPSTLTRPVVGPRTSRYLNLDYEASNEPSLGSGSEEGSSSDTLRSLHEPRQMREGQMAIRFGPDFNPAIQGNIDHHLRPMTFHGILNRQREQRISNAISMPIGQRSEERPSVRRQASLSRRTQSLQDSQGARPRTTNTRRGESSYGSTEGRVRRKIGVRGTIVDLVSSDDGY